MEQGSLLLSPWGCRGWTRLSSCTELKDYNVIAEMLHILSCTHWFFVGLWEHVYSSLTLYLTISKMLAYTKTLRK